MMKYLLMLIFLFPVVANAGEDVEFIPKGSLWPMGVNWQDDYNEKRYSSILSEMNESSLFQRVKNKQQSECYRFYWDSPFQNKICIRIEIYNTGEIKVFTKIIKYYVHQYDVYKEGLVERGKSISKNDLQPLLKKLNKLKFWELRSKDFPPQNLDDKSYVMDASTYYFEGVKNDKYQLVEIAMLPDKLRENIYQLGHLFFSLSDVHNDDFDYMKKD
jgi:hypothetical protein